VPPSRGQRTGNLDKMCAARVYTSCIRVRLNKKKSADGPTRVDESHLRRRSPCASRAIAAAVQPAGLPGVGAPVIVAVGTDAHG